MTASDLFPERVETDRLLLEQFCAETVETHAFYEAFAEGHADPAVFEHVPEDPYVTPKEASDRIADAERRWQEGSAAKYVVRPRDDSASEDGDVAGTALLYCEWERRTAGLGTILRRPFWGRGYAEDCISALLGVAFDHLDFEIVEAWCEDGNEKSRRALEKHLAGAGGECEGLFRNVYSGPDKPVDGRRFTITREQWETPEQARTPEQD